MGEGDLARAVGEARIGMLAVGARRPLVNPAAFYQAAGSIWMTTSRRTVKADLIRRSPEAAFLVPDGRRSVLFQGYLETYDPRTVGGQVRAILGGPNLGFAVAGYVLRNAPFIGGYALDLRSMPDAWWPQNRVLLRLRVTWAGTVSEAPPPAPGATPIPGVVDAALAAVAEAYACWAGGDASNLAPAWWAPSGRGELAVWLPPWGPPGPVATAGGAVVIEHHHPYRASRMLGITLHGDLIPAGRTQNRLATAIERRYGVRPAGGVLLRVEPQRVTSWEGFKVATRPYPDRVEAIPPARPDTLDPGAEA